MYWLNCTATCPVAMLVLKKEPFFLAVDETIMNVVNDPKRRDSLRSNNYSDQHPRLETLKAKVVSVED